jgi:hypothetical protein
MSKDETTDEAPLDYVSRGQALITASLPTCTAAFDGTARSWRIFLPDFKENGISVEGPTPEDAILRARYVMVRL